MKNKGVIIYQAKSGAIELRGDFTRETIWATQAQITDIFNIDRTVVTKHIGNILKSQEVDEKSNVQKMHIANSDKPVAFYSLDMILAVGYRANSGRAIQFRQWATKTLRRYIVDGFAINKQRTYSTSWSRIIRLPMATNDRALLLSSGFSDRLRCSILKN